MMMVCFIELLECLCTCKHALISVCTHCPTYSYSFFPSAVTVQMEHTTYQVSEDGGSIEVCAIIVNNHTAECPVNFPISVRLSSSDGDAGIPM